MSLIPHWMLLESTPLHGWGDAPACLGIAVDKACWVIHRHRAGARKVRRVLRRHQQRVRAGWVVSAHEWTTEELS